MDFAKTDQRIKDLPVPADSGFFRENDSKSKTYFFFYVNSDGKVALISKIYRSARSRNKMQQRIEAGEYTVSPFRFEKKFGYQIINGGDKAICAGPLFAKAAERDGMLRSLPGELQPEPAESRAEGPLQRYSFRLNLYRAEDTGAWQSRISHPLTEEKQSFSGLNLTAIEKFIQSVIQSDPDSPALTVERETDSSEAKQKKMVSLSEQPQDSVVKSQLVAPTVRSEEPERRKPTTDTKIQEQRITILSGDKILINSVAARREPIDIEFALNPHTTDKDIKQVEVSAKSLTTGNTSKLLTRKEWMTKTHALHVPLITSNLGTGPYRITAEVSVQTEEEVGQTTYATGILQII